MRPWLHPPASHGMEPWSLAVRVPLATASTVLAAYVYVPLIILVVWFPIAVLAVVFLPGLFFVLVFQAVTIIGIAWLVLAIPVLGSLAALTRSGARAGFLAGLILAQLMPLTLPFAAERIVGHLNARGTDHLALCRLFLVPLWSAQAMHMLRQDGRQA